MSDLLLPDLEIIGFRGFDHLSIERLGRVNVVAGRNGVGKSSLLEALRVYAKQGEPAEVLSILESRDEGMSPVYLASDGADRALLLRSLFFGRPALRTDPQLCSIGPTDPEKILRLSVARSGRQISTDEYSQLVFDASDTAAKWSELIYSIELGSNKRLAAIMRRTIEYHGDLVSEMLPCMYLKAVGLSNGELGHLWDVVALTDLEDHVIDALHIIGPSITRISMIGQPTSPLGGRVPIVKLAGFGEPVPLRSLGDGLTRLFGIALVLVNARNGLLLIDEIENGLHYSVQAQVWDLLFTMAHRLNVQVFATTHSWDCIDAFQHAACKNSGSDGLLIRLENKKGQITPTIFDAADLAIATREQIEVR